jgi:sugar phosphate isomerase/epimerase
MNKRTFLKNAASISLGIGIMPNLLATDKSITRKIGLQLYTVRDLMAADPRGTLAQIAQIGYTEIETSGYSQGKLYGMDPVEFNKIITDLGMRIISGHISIDQFENDWDRILHMANTLDQQYMVLPYLLPDQRTGLDVYHRMISLLNKRGEEARKSGKVVAYHNHDFEFDKIDNITPLELLLNETDPELVQFELDLYWVTRSGNAPLDLFKKFSKRFTLWHVKDMNDQRDFTEVGNGTIDFSLIFDNFKLSGMKHFFIEQDQSVNPIESIRTSFKNVQSYI